MTDSPPPPLYGAPADEEPVPVLDPELVADDDDLALAVDAFIQASPEARARQGEIALLHDELRQAVDIEAWRIVMRLDELTNARLADITVEIARFAFSEGRRHPVPATDPSNVSSDDSTACPPRGGA